MKVRFNCSALSVVGFLFCSSVLAAPVRVHVIDAAGEGFPKILVIARSLERPTESDRELTNNNGLTTALNLGSGLYQIIASDPYGTWPTTVREFILGNQPIDITLQLDVPGTNDQTWGPAAVGVPIKVLDRHGHPVANATVLGRDPEAKFMHFYRTDQQGNATPVLGVNGAYIVVFYQGQVHTEEVNIPYNEFACDDSECIKRHVADTKPAQSRTIHLK
jgi:hypothetical protein